MIPTFDEVMVITSTIANVHSLQIPECQAMYETLLELPDGAIVVEVGCDTGRSSSLISQVAAAKDFLTIHIDPWEWFPERAKEWMENIAERCPKHRFIVMHMKTEQAYISGLIDCAFIDGSHNPEDVQVDLDVVASRVMPGGFLMAHDYPSGGVTETIDPYVATGWTKYKQAMGFGVWRRNGI